MNVQMPQQVTHDSTAAPDQQKLRVAVTLLTLTTIAAILIGYRETTWSMISIWLRSETFAHGFLIFPFSAYLIWGQRKHLVKLSSQPNLLALPALASLGFCWLLATLAGVQVFAQLLLIAMVPATVWAMLGSRIVWALAFPLTYLLLAVPFGDGLISPLIDFTADFTVTALQWTGIPVYREGSFFSIPSGNWSVVEACSGLRYLIASFTLGTLYAYMTYRSLRRRLAFIALSVIVPIVANGIRAYLIVMTGHLSDMQLAVGIDHLIYGWVFFGVVMLLLFWIGSFWREDDNEYDIDNTSTSTGIGTAGEHENRPDPAGRPVLRSTVFAAAAVLAVAYIWPLYADHLEREYFGATASGSEIEIPGIRGKWRISSSQVSDWKPEYVGATAQLLQTYRNREGSVDLYISYYRNQQQGAELISYQNVLAGENGSSWHDIKQDKRSVSFGPQEETVNQNSLHSSSKKLLVWRWYSLGGEITASPYLAKLILARNKLLGRGGDGAEIIVAAQYDETPDEAVPVLQTFLGDMLPAITDVIRNAGNR
ncbi:exosortase A [Nitrosovibrio sp. Nv4]|uniref:exosortase A n=1 Tax=Nitrosovibrio sp. Nv4 TaxID=1945880 RepID=UPI000BCB54BF|nr:exosortase A [Nitrosovibrio sp. Nv4]SOD39986.1 exosortase A [Nitrosovibrio sp. Nv4]